MEASVDLSRVDAVLERWGRDGEFVIEMLQDVQREFRHLPQAALRHISRATGTDLGRLIHIATFYKAFSLEPRGEVALQVCLGTACHVRGAARVMDALSRELEVKPGGTTADGRYTLEGVRCLGCCGLAPVVTIGPELHAEVDSARVVRLLRRSEKQRSAAAEEDDD